MPKYTVRFTGNVDSFIKVNAEDPDTAIDNAYAQGIGDLCASCTGWGQTWGREEGEEMEVYSVEDENENEVLTEDTYLDQLRKQVEAQAEEIRELKARLAGLEK
jgi:hypothetical protein